MLKGAMPMLRMRDMGIAPFNIASSVILITAQRLARRLCPQCKEPADIPREALLEAGYDEADIRSEEHTSELQSQSNLVCRLLLEKKKSNYKDGGKSRR